MAECVLFVIYFVEILISEGYLYDKNKNEMTCRSSNVIHIINHYQYC